MSTRMKFWLSIILIIAVCGLVTYIVVFETGWLVAREEAAQSLGSTQISEIISKAKVYRKTGHTGKAIQILKEALKKDPDNFTLTIELGRSYEQNGDINLTISTYEKACSINPKHYLPYKLLGFLYFNHKKNKAKAKSYLEKSLALNLNQPDVKRFLANIKGQPVAMPKRPPIPTKPAG